MPSLDHRMTYSVRHFTSGVAYKGVERVAFPDAATLDAPRARPVGKHPVDDEGPPPFPATPFSSCLWLSSFPSMPTLPRSSIRQGPLRSVPCRHSPARIALSVAALLLANGWRWCGVPSPKGSPPVRAALFLW